jgi:hypothetical protein
MTQAVHTFSKYFAKFECAVLASLKTSIMVLVDTMHTVNTNIKTAVDSCATDWKDSVHLV